MTLPVVLSQILMRNRSDLFVSHQGGVRLPRVVVYGGDFEQAVPPTRGSNGLRFSCGRPPRRPGNAFPPYLHRPLQTRALGSRGFLLRWYERRLAGDYLPASGPFDKDIREAPRPAHIALLSSLESHSAGDDRDVTEDPNIHVVQLGAGPFRIVGHRFRDLLRLVQYGAVLLRVRVVVCHDPLECRAILLNRRV